MKDQASPPDGHALVQWYESLRNSALGSGGCAQSMMRARALLVFKGMAAWMKGVGEVSMSSTSPSTSPAIANNGLKLPEGFEQNLVDIVATMALATAMEVTA